MSDRLIYIHQLTVHCPEGKPALLLKETIVSAITEALATLKADYEARLAAAAATAGEASAAEIESLKAQIAGLEQQAADDLQAVKDADPGPVDAAAAGPAA